MLLFFAWRSIPMSEQPRIPLLAPEALKPPFGSLNVTRTIGQNRALLDAWGGFATYILGPDLTISPRERELVILRVGWNHQASYEWSHHVEIGKTVGLSDDDILAVQAGPSSAHWGELEALVLRAADELKSGGEISGASWEALKRHYSDQQMLDLLMTVGQYTMVCMVLNSARVQLEDGYEGLPA
jgi:alkylhydroperoxidase family enzyme